MAAPEAAVSSLAPLDLDEVLSPEWLTGMLAASFPGVEVADAHVTEKLVTVATKVRFDVDYAHRPEREIPDAFCVKGYFDLDPDATAGSLAAGAGETAFYRELAPTLDVRTPPCVHAGSDPETGHALIVMHDLVATGSTFLSALSPYSIDQTAATLDQLARLHAARWDDPRLADVPWLTSRIATIAEYVPATRVQEGLEGPRGAALPVAVLDAPRLLEALRALVARTDGEVRCIVHGDAHAGNIYLTPDEGPGLIDWQLVHRGSWAFDVAYHVAAVLSVEDRRGSERDLLAHYLGCLERHGGVVLDAEHAWLDYRAALAYGYFLWAITQRVEPEIIIEFTTRLGTAVADHGSFELLGV